MKRRCLQTLFPKDGSPDDVPKGKNPGGSISCRKGEFGEAHLRESHGGQSSMKRRCLQPPTRNPMKKMRVTREERSQMRKVGQCLAICLLVCQPLANAAVLPFDAGRKIVRNPQWEAARQLIENRATQRQLDHQAKLWDIVRRSREEVNDIQRSVISNMQQTGERVIENWDNYIRDVDVRNVPGVGKVEFSSLADKEWYDPKTGEHVIYNGGDGGFDPQKLGMTGLVSRDEYPRAR